MTPVLIRARGMITAAGPCLDSNWSRYLRQRSALDSYRGRAVGRVTAATEKQLCDLYADKATRDCDRAVALGILAARQAATEIKTDLSAWGVIFGSSRGATHTIEKEHTHFLQKTKLKAFVSPETTSGAFPAAIARDLNCQGLSLFVSSACSTSLHAIGIGAQFVSQGFMPGAFVGGSEASITDFTLAQLEAIKIYGKENSVEYPYRPFTAANSGMIIGEGAVCLGISAASSHDAGVKIVGYGAATEWATRTGVSNDGEALVRSMQQALQAAGMTASEVDFVVGHGAGTKKGDAAELAAYRRYFADCPKLPKLVGHKWLFGHLLGASAAASVALACEHLLRETVPDFAYLSENPLGPNLKPLSKPKTALVTSLGFGGNAGALVLTT